MSWPNQLALRLHPLLRWEKAPPETEFLPAALEIIETPAAPLGRAIAVAIIGFFLIALIWACLGTLDVITTAQGKIIPTERTKVIQPLETGVVRAIHIQDGQTVKAGDLLIEIDPTINEAERNRLEQELLQARFDVARLRAALASADGVIPPNLEAPEQATPEQTALQQNMLENQIAAIRAKLSNLDQQILQGEGNLAAVQSTIAKLRESMPLLEKRNVMRSELARKGYGSKLDSLATQQDLVEQQHELEVQQGRQAEASGALAALKEQRREAEADYRRTILSELAQAEQKASSLQEQLVQATQKTKLQSLTAPVHGTVQQLSVHTEGGVVTPAQALLAIVPADSKLEIEAMVPNRDIGFVQVGQEVAVKVDTFNFTKYGLLNGTVVSVSQDAITRANPTDAGEKKSAGANNDSSEPKGQELVYAARISLEQTQMQIDDRLVNLTPGMAVTAEIKTATRRVIDYLLSPLLRHKHQAMRER
jgi:hemolysin D